MQSVRKGMIVVVSLAMLGVWATAQNKDAPETRNVNVTVGEKSGVKESVTVVQPGPGGATQVLRKEVIKNDDDKKAEQARPPAVADETPRKARVVVVPAVFAQAMRNKAQREINEMFGLTDPAALENPGYTSYIIDALVNTRKLDVLEREDLRSVKKEIDFGESEYVDLEKAVKIGRMLNADYVVLPEIRVFTVWRDNRPAPYVGQDQKRIRGKFETTVRTVDVASSKIVASRVDEVERTARIRERDNPRVVVEDLIGGMYKDSALKEGANIIDVAYPIKIISFIDDDHVIVNRGRGAIMPDEVLKVYETGEMMTDPDTKDNLGYNEAYAGSVKITEINEKTSKAVIVEKKGVIKKLSICRRDRAPSTAAPIQQPAPKLD
ncbi:MAG: CsgG/HfaB family protein [Kiritimatiellia bacterium]|jgi:hypothetical protein